MRITLDDGRTVVVAGAVAAAIGRLVWYAPSLAPLRCWKARIDVKDTSVRLVAEAPVRPPGSQAVQ
jgi:hypothetical protein